MAIRPSQRLAMLLLLSHAMAATIVCATAMPQAARLALLAAILGSLAYYLARDALLRLPDSWHEVSFKDGSASVVSRGGSAFSGRMASKTVVSPYFVVLRIRPEGCRLPVFRTLFPDMLGADEFRELCVRLRFQ